MPLVGPFTQVTGSLFVDREIQNDKDKMRRMIRQRQEEVEQGIFPPLYVFAEGGTTNGTHLVKFKTGAFEAMKSV